jgi:predicted DNA-binding transcriptional regulator YafY
MSTTVSRKLERILRIIRRLLDRDECSVAQLAKDFEVHKLTIYRDLSTISAAGVRIAFHRRGRVRYYKRWSEMPATVRMP